MNWRLSITISLALLSACSSTKTTRVNSDGNEYKIIEMKEDYPGDIKRHSLADYALPKYPEELLDKGIEGYVVVEFDIATSGPTENIEIVESDPNSVFDRTTIESVKTWIYSPAYKGDTLYRVNNLRQILKYCIREEDLPEGGQPHRVCWDDKYYEKLKGETKSTM